MAPGDPSVSSSRLRSAGPEARTLRVPRRLPDTVLILSLLMGVSAFATQPEEHTGKK